MTIASKDNLHTARYNEL